MNRTQKEMAKYLEGEQNSKLFYKNLQNMK